MTDPPTSHSPDHSFQLDPDCRTAILHPPAAWEAVLPEMQIRTYIEDFEVEEIPSYLPDGVGEHLFLWLEKRDTSASDFISRLSRQLNVAVRDIGVAGQKDRRAITRQFVSVPRSCESRLSTFEDDNIRILSVSAHGNKLRTGHLKGNRFRIVLRSTTGPDISPETIEAAAKRLAAIQELGFPNYFGPQRFGIDGSSLTDGIQLLRDPTYARRWNPQKRRFLKKMLPSAVQAGVFNLVLSQRVAGQSFRTPMAGDIVCSKTGIRPFAFEDAAPELTELVPMGPMLGPKMLPASQQAAGTEETAFATLGLAAEDFAGNRKQSPGTRRRMVAFPTATQVVAIAGNSLQLEFTLGSGSFATVLLNQLGPIQAWRKDHRENVDN